MKPEYEQRLHAASKEHLIQLLEELALRHPVLLTEITSMLENLAHELPQTEDASDDTGDTGDAGEVSEEWDFNSDTQLHSLPSQQAALPTGDETRNQHVDEFFTRLQQAETPQELFDVLRDLVEDAVSYIGRGEDSTALALFALLIDERLLERKPDTVPLFDEMIDAGMYSLEALLGEVSNYTLFDVDTTVALSPLLTPDVRHRWLERLFALWLKRLDAHQVEEDLPELLLDVARSEDMVLLRSLVQDEIQKQPHAGHAAHANIVDFGHQYRSRALEKFLKELPRT